MKDSLCIVGSQNTEGLSFAHLQNMDLSVSFSTLDKAFDRTIRFHPGDFNRDGKFYVIELIFPLFFMYYKLSYGASDSNFMDFCYRNGQLFYFFKGEYEACELESFN